MKYFSMFSGVGGFELGIQRAYRGVARERKRDSGTQRGQETLNSERVGDTQADRDLHDNRDGQQATCIGYSEIDKYAIETYQHNFKGHKNYGDATKINERELPDFDLLVGGFPCQAFSVAGKRHGFNDTRGTLFFDIARILKHKRPRHLVLENVKGLLSHDSGKTFQTILGVLTDLGYDVEWQVLNAKDFGVPQNRERVFIVGHLGNECGHQVFPINGNNGQTLKNAGYLNSETWQKRNESTRRVYDPSGLAPTTPTGTGGGVMTKIVAQRGRENGQQLELRPDENTNTITSVAKDNLVGIDLSTKKAQLTSDARTIQARYNKGYSHRTAETTGVYDGAKIRRLTPLECERLMSWPDNWTIGSDTQRYKQCGNGVVSNVVQAVIEKLINTG